MESKKDVTSRSEQFHDFIHKCAIQRNSKKRISQAFILILAVFTLSFSTLYSPIQVVAAQNDISGDVIFESLLNDYAKMSIASEGDLIINELYENPEAAGIPAHTPTLGSYDDRLPASAAQNEALRASITAINEIDPDTLSEQNRWRLKSLNMDTALLMANEENNLLSYANDINPSDGKHITIPLYLSLLEFESLDDFDTYIALCNDFLRYFTELSNVQKEVADAGLLIPADNIAKSIAYCESFIAQPKDNLLITIFNQEIDDYASENGVDALTVTAYKDRVKSAVLHNVIPAYELMIATLQEIMPKSLNLRTGEKPGGKEYYTKYLQANAGISLSTDELYQMLQGVAEELRNEGSMLFNEGGEQLFADVTKFLTESFEVDYKKVIETLRTAVANEMPDVGAYEYEIKYFPPELAAIGYSGVYMMPKLDRPPKNVIILNKDSELTQNLSMYGLLAHEGIPGHMYQQMYTRKMINGRIDADSVITTLAYLEGWGAYAQLCAFQYLDLDENVIRYIRCVEHESYIVQAMANIGINYYAWDVYEVQDFMLLFYPEYSLEECYQYIDAITALDPAINNMYAYGVTQFLEMRSEAEEAFGEAFDPIEFHKFCLDNYMAPFQDLRIKFTNEFLTKEGDSEDANTPSLPRETYQENAEVPTTINETDMANSNEPSTLGETEDTNNMPLFIALPTFMVIGIGALVIGIKKKRTK